LPSVISHSHWLSWGNITVDVYGMPAPSDQAEAEFVLLGLSHGWIVPAPGGIPAGRSVELQLRPG